MSTDVDYVYANFGRDDARPAEVSMSTRLERAGRDVPAGRIEIVDRRVIGRVDVVLTQEADRRHLEPGREHECPCDPPGDDPRTVVGVDGAEARASIGITELVAHRERTEPRLQA